MRKLSFAMLISLACWSEAAAAASWELVRAGTLLAVPGQPPKPHQTVVIRDGRIVEIVDGFPEPAQLRELNGEPADVVDLSDKFVMPGLIDAHTHLQYGHVLNNVSSDALQDLTKTDADWAISGVVNAHTVLINGFTSVRNVGDYLGIDRALKRAINAGAIPGPRMQTAGAPLGPTGTQNDPKGFRPDLEQALEDEHGDEICDGPIDCRRKARKVVRDGNDLVKVKSSGGIGITLGRPDPRLFPDELEAIVTAAHDLGVKVAAHAISSKSIKASLRAGVDSIEHGTQIDDEAVVLFRKTGAYLVPTLLAPAEWVKQAVGSGRPVTQAQVDHVWQETVESMKRAHQGGVKFAFGTDIGFSKHANENKEFLYLAEVGLSPMEALKAATVNAADLMGWSKDVGSVEPGKWADLVATDASPLDDIHQMLDISFVMKGGQIYKRNHKAVQ